MHSLFRRCSTGDGRGSAGRSPRPGSDALSASSCSGEALPSGLRERLLRRASGPSSYWNSVRTDGVLGHRRHRVRRARFGPTDARASACRSGAPSTNTLHHTCWIEALRRDSRQGVHRVDLLHRRCAGLARGYLGRPGADGRAVFIPDPFAESRATAGSAALRGPGTSCTLPGRRRRSSSSVASITQVKVRGHFGSSSARSSRCIGRHPAVSNDAVVSGLGARARTISCVSSRRTSVPGDDAELCRGAARAASLRPGTSANAYMVPAFGRPAREFPVERPAARCDRKALPAPEDLAQLTRAPFVRASFRRSRSELALASGADSSLRAERVGNARQLLRPRVGTRCSRRE